MQICFTMKGPDLIFTHIHSPHSWLNNCTPEEAYAIKQEFHQDLLELLLEHNTKMHIACGDLNVRLHARLDGEEEMIGPFVYGRGKEFVEALNQFDRDHREFLISCLRCAEFVHCNSFFEKSSDKRFLHPGGSRRWSGWWCFQLLEWQSTGAPPTIEGEHFGMAWFRRHYISYVRYGLYRAVGRSFLPTGIQAMHSITFHNATSTIPFLQRVATIRTV